ncbi:UDP-D-glucuronate 4-epimerase 4 [Actinidia rufa]|uniref:UDP-D-glucuronate 4-epimerase 4 n=1 Tax=Actinidia rufa TaxID=165716 RepID=A0A7J0EV44_9ERIC|nr:UDP-D-glucuronate 4-epimerase 4 [Actinidia rufa]
MEKSPYIHRLRLHSSLAKLTFWSFVFLGLILVFFFRSPSSSSSIPSDLSRRSLRTHSWGGPAWEKRVRSSTRPRSRNGFSVLVTGAGGFVGTHVSAALKRRGDGVLGLDNFNDYYDPSLKRARQALLERSGIFIAGVRYAMENPSSYVHSNIAGLVSVLEGKSIPIFESANHGTVARDFTYIDDIVKGCLGALDTAEKSTGSGGKKKGPAQLRVFNLGNTSPVPVSDLVSILERLLKVKAKRSIVKLPRNGDVPFTHANISSAQREFGYYGSGKKSAQ